MLKEHYGRGREEALARLKIADPSQGAQARDASIGGQAQPASPRGAPSAVSPPIASGAAKSKVLG